MCDLVRDGQREAVTVGCGAKARESCCLEAGAFGSELALRVHAGDVGPLLPDFPSILRCLLCAAPCAAAGAERRASGMHARSQKLLSACSSGDIGVVREILSEGISPSFVDEVCVCLCATCRPVASRCRGRAARCFC
jgi:hypothetical protein